MVMPSQAFVSTYRKGLDQDTSKNLRGNDSYYNAENFRILTRDGLDNGALTNIGGNIRKFELPVNHVYLGSTQLRDETIIFSHDGDYSFIYSYQHDGNNNNIQTPVTTNYTANGFVNPSEKFRLIYTDGPLHPSHPLPIGDRLRFDNSTYIRAVARYENENVQKVYWIDGVHPIRMLNIVYDSELNPIADYTKGDINLIPDVTMSTPEFLRYGAGNLDVGVICYAYQLYRVYGSETPFSPCGELISLTDSRLDLSTARIKGGEVDTNSFKSVIGTINNLDTSFTSIRVVALHYSLLNTEPTIRIVLDREYDNTILNFEDTGQSLGSYTLEEFRFVARNFIPSTIDTKNDYLFVGNVEEDIFDIDFDARAYRFNNAGTPYSRIYTASPTGSYDTVDTSFLVGGGSIPADHDAINPYNFISLDGTANAGAKWTSSGVGEFKYQTDGSTLGGEGPRVSYIFTTRPYKVDDNTDERAIDTPITNSNIEWLMGIKRTWWRDEIYRFGLILFDDKGRTSNVKWIADIRMPDISENSTTYAIAESVTYNAFKALYPVFTVDISGTDAVAWQIVYVKREDKDKTIVAQGLASHSMIYTATTPDQYRPTVEPRWIATGGSPSYTEERKAMTIISPEVCFNVLKDTSNTTLIYTAGVYNAPTKTEIQSDNTLSSPVYNGPTWSSSIRLLSKYKSNKQINTSEIRTIDTLTIRPPENPNGRTGVDLNLTYNYVNWCQVQAAGGGNFGYCGTTAVVSVATAFSANDGGNITGYQVPLVNLKQDVTQYGGYTYNDRKYNFYISASDIDSGGTTDCYYGDTFIGYFDYLRTIWDEDLSASDKMNHFIYLPVETSINLLMRLDDCYHRIRDNAAAILMRETAGVWDGDGKQLIQNTDLYRYNTIYSQVDNSKESVPNPIDFETTKSYDVRVYNSDKKTNGEFADSWLKFRSENYIEVDSTLGSLQRIFTKDNYLTFWQPSGFGILEVEPRSLISDNNVGALVLGTGGVLSRYDYVSRESGIYNHDALVDTPEELIFFDAINLHINSFSGRNSELTKVLGVKSWLEQNLTNTSTAIGIYSSDFSETWLTFDSNHTLCYNGLTRAFTSFYTFDPNHYIRIASDVYSADNDRQFYIHDVDEAVRCEFYNNRDDSEITYIINPNSNLINIFDAIEFMSNVHGSYTTSDNFLSVPNGKTVLKVAGFGVGTNGNYYENISGSPILINIATDYTVGANWRNLGTNSNIADETFSTAIFENDYQTSALQVFQLGDGKRRLRTWRMHVPRNSGTYERMRDSYLKATFTYYNEKDKKFTLYDLITHYRQSQY